MLRSGRKRMDTINGTGPKVHLSFVRPPQRPVAPSACRDVMLGNQRVYTKIRGEQVVHPTHLHTQLQTDTQIGHCKRAKQHARRRNDVPNRHAISSCGQQRHRPSTAEARATYSIMEYGSKVFHTGSDRLWRVALVMATGPFEASIRRALPRTRTHGAGTNA